jgi:hypothetical protein
MVKRGQVLRSGRFLNNLLEKDFTIFENNAK